MKPTITLNLIDTNNLHDKDLINAVMINSEAEELSAHYSNSDITYTTDNNRPHIIISCSLERGVDESNRNFTRPF